MYKINLSVLGGKFKRVAYSVALILFCVVITGVSSVAQAADISQQDRDSLNGSWVNWDPSVVGCSAQANGSTSTSNSTPTATVAAFVDKYGKMAYDASIHTSVPYEFTLGQAIIESGYGGSSLSAKYNNFFGIKADSSWKGATVSMPTQEVINGVPVTVNAKFRAYTTAQAGFADHDAFFHENQRYAGAFKFSHDPLQFLATIAAAGYATDPKYVTTVGGIIKQVQTYIASKHLWPPSSAVTYDTNSPGSSSSSSSASEAGVGCSCPGTGSSDASSQPSLDPSLVPPPYADIFTKAGSKFNVSPAFLAAIFYGGEHGNSFPSPPPPYGKGPAWASSTAGAQGPFQFIPGTWKAYGVDGNGDGRADVNDLTDGAFGAANYFAKGMHVAGTVDEAKLRQAAADYNGIHDPQASYPDNVWKAFQKFSSGTGTSSCPGGGGVGGYKNPYRDIKGLTPMRIDQGVDYGGSGPIYALGNGTVIYATTSAGWPGGNFVSYRLSDGPAKDKIVFVAEHCPLAVSVGEHVTTSTVLCNLQNGFPFSESGWGTTIPQTAAASPAYHAVADGTATAYGKNFNDLLVKLGVPSGTYQFSNQKGGKNLAGSLPSGWPTW